jgi:hypothetical protein
VPEPSVEVARAAAVPGDYSGLLVTESTFAGETHSASTSTPLTVTLDHRADDSEVLSLRVGEEFFALEQGPDRSYIVRGGWRVPAEDGRQTAIRGDESAEVMVSHERDSQCDVVEVSREWTAVSPLHATSESLRLRICATGEVHEVATETRFPAGSRSLLWSAGT